MTQRRRIEGAYPLQQSLGCGPARSRREAALQRRIEMTDWLIDALVYELYELTPEEIKVVEGAQRMKTNKRMTARTIRLSDPIRCCGVIV